MPSLARNRRPVTSRRQTRARSRAGSHEVQVARAMAELEQGKGKRFDSAEALFEDLGI
jgi:hypothetical protein